jgi:hypothetical protein
MVDFRHGSSKFRHKIVEDRSVRGPVDGRSWLWWVIDNTMWTDSWSCIAGAGCGLICVGAGEERARLEGPGGQHGRVQAAWWQEKQDEVVDKSRCRVAAHDRSLHTGFVAVHHKTVRLLSWATKPRSEAQRAETGSWRAEKLRCRRTRGGIAGLASTGRRLKWRRGRAMKRSATWSICPWEVCIAT